MIVVARALENGNSSQPQTNFPTKYNILTIKKPTGVGQNLVAALLADAEGKREQILGSLRSNCD